MLYNMNNMHIIPLGEECYTCQSIDSKFSNSLRKNAYPFDYVGHTYIEKIYDNLLDLFKDKIYLNKNDFDMQLFNKKYYFVHKKYGFKYWHDISSDNSNLTEDEMNLFFDKYNRRYKRLYDIIHNSEAFRSASEDERLNSETLVNEFEKTNVVSQMTADSIIFLSVNHFDNIYNKITKQNEIIKLYNLLQSINKNITFLAINYGKDDGHSSNLKFINLPVDTNLCFTKSKELFTSKLYEYVYHNLEHSK